MEQQELIELIRQKQSYLCVGLDPDAEKLPSHLTKDSEGLVAFCKAIIDATLPYAVSYKVNSAFFEAFGEAGWRAMREVFIHLQTLPVFAIADAKRGDIGNTSGKYAQAFFDDMEADALTLSPYMGEDSISPFLQYENKTAILLALTSNPGHADFEMLTLENGKKLYEQVLETSQKWPRKGGLMYVIGATRSEQFAQVRKLSPDSFFLVPGVGAQGGNLAEISRLGFNKDIGLLVNASRSIIHAGMGTDFAEKAAEEAKKMQEEMKGLMGVAFVETGHALSLQQQQPDHGGSGGKTRNDR